MSLTIEGGLTITVKPKKPAKAPEPQEQEPQEATEPKQAEPPKE